ncbi:MAG TPA: ChaN family lipoprotein [Nitrospinota bacterium]|nr:ChaN family lipoprotein [Nitrospinota bacterium]
MKQYFSMILFLSLMGCASLNLLSPFTDSIINLRTGEEVSFNTLIHNIKNVRVVIIGETHNQKRHHDIQLKIIQEIHRKNSLITVGMEMFQQKSNEYLEKWSYWKLDEIEMKLLFSKNWTKTYYPLYVDILRFIRDESIPLIGLNIPRKVTHKIATKGFKSLSKEERSSLPRVSCDIPQNYRSYLEEVYELNSHKKGSFENFCEAQVLWDSVMAYHAVQFLKENQDYQLIILAGSIHAQRLGILARIRERMNVTARIIIPKAGEDQDDRKITNAEADYLWIMND